MKLCLSKSKRDTSCICGFLVVLPQTLTKYGMPYDSTTSGFI